MRKFSADESHIAGAFASDTAPVPWTIRLGVGAQKRLQGSPNSVRWGTAERWEASGHPWVPFAKLDKLVCVQIIDQQREKATPSMGVESPKRWVQSFNKLDIRAGSDVLFMCDYCQVSETFPSELVINSSAWLYRTVTPTPRPPPPFPIPTPLRLRSLSSLLFQL